MAVTSVAETYARQGTQNSKWQRTYQRTWTVLTDSPTTDAVLVMAALPVAPGTVYRVFAPNGSLIAQDKGAFVQDLTVTCDQKDGVQWTAVANYGPYDASQFPQNPLDWPLRISWSAEQFERVADEDKNGDPIVNSAGDFFDPPLTVDDSRPILRIVRNEPSYDPSLAATYKDALNSNTFFGEDPYKWKCKPITAELEFNRDSGTSDGYYYVVTYEFQFNPDTWKVKLLDQGLRVLDGSNDPVPVNQKDGTPATEPVPLDGNGAKLATGGNPVFLEFEVYQEADFSALNLDPAGEPGQS